MPAIQQCPTDDSLEQLMLGLGDAAEAGGLERHVEECPDCAARVKRLAAEDELVRAARAAAADTDQPEAIDSLVDVFRRMGQRHSGTISWSPHSRIEDEAPIQPAALGRIGPFTLQELLGAGGMGKVYRGYDPRLQRAVAIKVVRPDLLVQPGMTERFLQEARAAAAVEHDHIVVVHEVEVHDGVPCLVMPLLRGQSLESRLRNSPGPLPEADVLRLARELADGLSAAHERGLIHRDIKPANVWLEAPNNRVRILDFGLAVAFGTAGGFAGTPGFIAPELFRSRDIDHRADLFSLGCLLYRAATGTAAFDGENSTATFVHTITRNPAPAAEANRKLDPEFGALIDRLLAKKPAERPDSAADVIRTVDGIAIRRAEHRKKLTRRRWLGGVVAAAGVTGAAVWLARPPRQTPLPPGKLVFETGPGVGRVVFSRDGRDETFDLANDGAVSLPAGTYSLRADDAAEGQRLVPAEVEVEPDADKRVKLALVGEIERFTPHSQPVSGVACVPSGVLSAGLDRLLALSRRGAEAKFVKLASPCRAFAATQDGRFAVTAGGNGQEPTALDAVVWTVDGLKPRATLEDLGSLSFSIAIAPDGNTVLTTTKHEQRLWDLKADPPRSRALADGHPAGTVIHAAAFDAEGRFAVTAGERGQTILWEVAKAALATEVNALAAGEARNAVRAVVFAGTSFITGGDDGVIRFWSGPPYRARELDSTAAPVRSLAASPDGTRLLSGGADGAIKLWSVAKGTLLERFTGHSGAVTALSFAADGRHAASGGADRTVRVWRLPFD